MANIPSVDLKNFLSDDQSLKQDFVNKLGKAYQDIGFVALKGHFLKDSDIENIYINAKKTINSFKLFAKIWKIKRMKQKNLTRHQKN